MPAERIKLFADAHSFDRGFQGTQTFIHGLYQELHHYPDLDIYFGTGDAEKILQHFPGIDPSRILLYKSGFSGVLRFVYDIPYYLRKYRFDFAHFQYLAPKRVQGCRYIVTLHDTLYHDLKKEFPAFYRYPRQVLFGSSIRRAHIKTTVSDYSRDRIADVYQIPPEHVHIISNAVCNTYPAPPRTAARRLVQEKYGISNFILFVSRIEPRKNHLLLLEKYLKLELYKRGITLVLIGQESVAVPALKFRLQNLSNEQRRHIHWIRQVDQQDLRVFYAACSLFVYPSKAEGFGIPPLEAAMCGAPVLCSASSAMKSFDFFMPYMFDPENPQEFENKLAQIIHTPPSYDFTERVAETIRQRYSWKYSSNRFYNLIRSHYK